MSTNDRESSDGRGGHTPEAGSWLWYQADDIDDGFVIWVGPNCGGNIPSRRPVHHVIEWEHGLDPDENPEQFDEAEAIADLIVAAPDLLAACKEVLCALPERSPMRPIVRAAIAKAEGKPHP